MQQKARQGHEKAAVHAGHRQNVVQPRLGEGRVGLFRDPAPVAGQNGRQESGGIPWEKDLDAFPHGPAHPGGKPAGTVPGPLPGLQIPPGIGQEKNAFGGEGGNILIPDAGGVVEPGLSSYGLAGRQVQQLLPGVEHRLAGNALHADLRPGAEIRFLGVAAEGGGEVRPPPRHFLGGPLDLAGVEPAPAQAQSQGGAEDHAPPPPFPGQELRQEAQRQRQPGARQYPAALENILGQKHAQGKAPGKHRQPPHGPPSSVSFSKPKTPGGVSLREPFSFYRVLRYSARIRRLPVSAGLSAVSSGTNSVLPSAPAAWATRLERVSAFSGVVTA